MSLEFGEFRFKHGLNKTEGLIDCCLTLLYEYILFLIFFKKEYCIIKHIGLITKSPFKMLSKAKSTNPLPHIFS